MIFVCINIQADRIRKGKQTCFFSTLVEFDTSFNLRVRIDVATRPPSSYEQHKVDAGNNAENTSNEDTSIEAQPSPAQANEADEQRAEEQLLSTMNIHDTALRKAYIVLYLEEEE